MSQQQQTIEPLDADCPICDRQVLRVTIANQAWGGDASTVKFLCSSGSPHLPLGWNPKTE